MWETFEQNVTKENIFQSVYVDFVHHLNYKKLSWNKVSRDVSFSRIPTVFEKKTICILYFPLKCEVSKNKTKNTN